LLNQKNYFLKSKRLTCVEIDNIKENISLKIGDDTEDHTNRVNGNKMDTNFIAHQKRDQENNNTDFGKVQNNKHRSAVGEQHTVMNKLKEDLKKMWLKLRQLQMSEREKLPKLKTNSKFIRIQEEINGVIEVLLEVAEMN
jgi:hypothetical protein